MEEKEAIRLGFAEEVKKYRMLYNIARTAAEQAYAPYSNFRVGAALLASDDRIFIGVNVENASYGATICAERTAFVKAISEGMRDFIAIAVASPNGAASPCGICRQFMLEFCKDSFLIISGKDDSHLEINTLKELLPNGFRL